MADVTIINKFGTMQGWNSITVNVLGRDLEGITNIKYDDNDAKENAMGSGRFAIGRKRMNYEATASLTLYKEEVDAIQQALPPGKRLQDIAAFDIVVVYELNDGSITKDIIRNAEFLGKSIDVTQGDGSIELEHPLIISHIDWNLPA